MQKTKKIQQVFWDEPFREELFTYVQEIENFDAQNSQQWRDALDHICRRHFPDADEYKIVLDF